MLGKHSLQGEFQVPLWFSNFDIVHVKFRSPVDWVEGAQTPPKMLTHFHRAWAGSRKSINVLRDELER